MNNIRVSTQKSEAKVQSETASYVEDKASKPKSKWRTGDEVVFRKKNRSSSIAKDNNSLKNSNIELNESLKSEIYPKWWGEKKVKIPFKANSKKKNLESSCDSRKYDVKHYEQNKNDISQNEEDSYIIYQAKKKDKEKEKEKDKPPNNQQKIISSSVEKKFHKKKPSTPNLNHIKTTQSRNKGEDTKIVMSFDMSNKNRFPFSKKNNVKKLESSNYQSINNSKSRIIQEHSVDRTPETKRSRIRKTESLDSQIESKPIRV